MKINELAPRLGKVDLIAEIAELGEIRTFEKFGKKGRVLNGTIKDETGTMKITFWNDEIDQVKVGSKIHITNGYVNEWQGEMQLSCGKYGKLEIVN